MTSLSVSKGLEEEEDSLYDEEPDESTSPCLFNCFLAWWRCFDIFLKECMSREDECIPFFEVLNEDGLDNGSLTVTPQASS